MSDANTDGTGYRAAGTSAPDERSTGTEHPAEDTGRPDPPDDGQVPRVGWVSAEQLLVECAAFPALAADQRFAVAVTVCQGVEDVLAGRSTEEIGYLAEGQSLRGLLEHRLAAEVSASHLAQVAMDEVSRAGWVPLVVARAERDRMLADIDRAHRLATALPAEATTAQERLRALTLSLLGAMIWAGGQLEDEAVDREVVAEGLLDRVSAVVTALTAGRDA